MEEVLRAAAVEVSTSSAKRRLRLFRHTLPPLIAKATGTHPIIVSALLLRDRSPTVICVFWPPVPCAALVPAHLLFGVRGSGVRALRSDENFWRCLRELDLLVDRDGVACLFSCVIPLKLQRIEAC